MSNRCSAWIDNKCIKGKKSCEKCTIETLSKENATLRKEIAELKEQVDLTKGHCQIECGIWAIREERDALKAQLNRKDKELADLKEQGEKERENIEKEIDKILKDEYYTVKVKVSKLNDLFVSHTMSKLEEGK